MRERSATVTVAPMRASSSSVVVTSFRCGTLPTVTGLRSEQRAAQDRQRRVLRSGNLDVAFERHAAFDLQLVHQLSARRSFFRREGFDRHGVDLPPHQLAERLVDELVTRDRALAREVLRDHARGEMRVVVGLDADVGAGQAGTDQLGNLLGIH